MRQISLLVLAIMKWAQNGGLAWDVSGKKGFSQMQDCMSQEEGLLQLQELHMSRVGGYPPPVTL